MLTSPHIRKAPSVSVIMLKVLAALLPAIAVYVYQFGAGILFSLAIASLAALAGESAMLALRGKPQGLFLTDGSALVTAWLLALSMPPLAPWWLVVAATLFAVVIAKHLYGGLGQNPFNPAMVAFCAMILAFPALMSQWPPQGLSLASQWHLIAGGTRELDAITAATVLDALRTGLRAAGDATVRGVMSASPAFGAVAGQGWEWIALAYLAGGLWLLQQRIISWHLPLAFLATMAATAGLFWLANPAQYAPPLFHLAAGGSLLAAFFIITDPVSGPTTPRGKLIFGAGCAFIAYTIRSFGAFPDGIAFAVLLMNICVPLIDMGTQPRIFGHREDHGAGK